MSDRAIHRFDVESRIQTFGKDHTADLAADRKAAGHLATLAQTLTDLDTAKAVLFDAVRLDLQSIARTARKTPRLAKRQPHRAHPAAAAKTCAREWRHHPASAAEATGRQTAPAPSHEGHTRRNQ